MQRFEVDGWVVDVTALTAVKGDVCHHLPNKAMQLLQLLALHPGEVVSHQTIEETVWDGNALVAKKAATNTIWQLRKALQSGETQESFIETIPRRGYRLNAPVASVEEREQRAVPAATAVSYMVGVAGLLLAAVLAYFVLSTNSAAPEQERLILTEYPGEETEPALSADGRKLAFIWSGPGRQPDIYWKYVDEEGLTPRQITNTPANEAKPSWAPDGKRLAYIRIQPDTRACAVYIHTLAAGSEEYLAECQSTLPGTLAWSPTGDQIAFSYKDETPGNLGHGIAVIDVQSRSITRLTKSPNIDFVDTDAAWSPAGDQLAFTRRTTAERDEIHITDLNGNSRQLMEAPADLYGITWSSENELIVAAIPEGEHRRQLLRISAQTGQTTAKLDQGALEAYVPAQAAAADMLAYDASNFVIGVGTITKDAVAVGGLPVISSLSMDKEPAVSPDGKTVVFTSMRTGSKEIWMHRQGRRVPEQLTAFGVTSVFGPSWSPDGSHLSFLAPGDSGNLHIHLLRLVDRTIWQLTEEATDHMPPSWAPDGRSILSARKLDNAWTIHRHHLASDYKLTSVEALVPGYIAKEHATGGLYVFRLTDNALFKVSPGGEASLFWADFERRDWGNWAVSSAGVYGLRRSFSGADIVMLRSHDRQQDTAYAKLPMAKILDQNSLALWPNEDGFHVAYYEMQQADIFALRPKKP